MNNKKLIILLIFFTVYINYNNYISKNNNKLLQDVSFIKNRIEKEKNFTLVEIQKIVPIPKEKLFFSNKNSFSQTMGEFQQLIEKKLKDKCKTKSINWQDSPLKKEWYTPLGISLVLECKANNFIKFQNDLRKTEKLITYRNIRIVKNRYSNDLSIVTELIAYRSQNEK